MKFDKKRITIFGVLLISVILFSVAMTYAFFSGNLGETGNEVVKVQAGTMELTFSDNDTLGNIEKTLNFGDTVEKELRIENSGTLDAYAKISWDDLTNTFTEGALTYTLEYKTGETGTYQPTTIKNSKVPTSSTASKQIILDYLKIPSSSTYVYKITITYNNLDVDQTQDLNATFTTKFTLDEGSNKYTSDEILTYLKLKFKKESPNFVNVATADETKDGLYALEDDYGTSYYYRGAAENNYVKFGKNKDAQDMYWRIIRFNGDGSARLIYDGTEAFANGTSNVDRYALTGVIWNANMDDAKYTGWMFGGKDGETSTSYEEATRNETDSDIKEKVDEWYVENIQETGYSKYLTDAIFCNDRELESGSGTGRDTTHYKVSGRLVDSKMPSFKCKNVNDRFTLKSSASLEVSRIEKVEGNKALTYPVGLMTADEMTAAGGISGVKNNNSKYYLYKCSLYYGWLLSPSFVNLSYTRIFTSNPNGSLGSNDVNFSESAIAPVINIASEFVMQFQGEGTIINPYKLKLD